MYIEGRLAAMYALPLDYPVRCPVGVAGDETKC